MESFRQHKPGNVSEEEEEMEIDSEAHVGASNVFQVATGSSMNANSVPQGHFVAPVGDVSAQQAVIDKQAAETIALKSQRDDLLELNQQLFKLLNKNDPAAAAAFAPTYPYSINSLAALTPANATPVSHPVPPQPAFGPFAAPKEHNALAMRPQAAFPPPPRYKDECRRPKCKRKKCKFVHEDQRVRCASLIPTLTSWAE